MREKHKNVHIYGGILTPTAGQVLVEQHFLCLLPDVPVGGGSLCDDGAGLGGGEGLLDHHTAVMAAHP